MRFLLCCVLVCSLIACSKGIDKANLPTPSPYSVSPTHGFQGVVLIRAGGEICTGVFVSPTTILTAAHCFKRTHQISVESSSQRINASIIALVGDGSSDDTYDLAILRAQNPNPQQEYYAIGRSINPGDTVNMVGYGCNENVRSSGGGIKRAGTNMVYKISDYIEVHTPTPAPRNHHGLLGPVNRAGSCFGDSGGPMFREENGQQMLVGLDHAVVADDDNTQISAYIDLTSNRVVNYLRQYNQQFGLGIAFAR